MKKNLKKTICTLLAAVSAFGCATTMAACTTDHPEVEMQISFNGETYTLDYKLYRKTAPATVEHFLYLVGNGYYDGLCVHDYTAAERLYTGEYTAAEGAEIEHKNYFETIASFDNYDAFPHSVWEDREKSLPTYTLKGEFYDNNGFTVESGALDETFGSLSMYYYGEQAATEKKVYVVRASEKGAVHAGQYQNNMATSAFFISLKTTKPSNSNYCTFATLKTDSRDDLEDLQKAIETYASEQYPDDEAEFTHSVSKPVHEFDGFLKDYKTTESFNVPKEPIVIKKVTVKKY